MYCVIDQYVCRTVYVIDCCQYQVEHLNSCGLSGEVSGYLDISLPGISVYRAVNLMFNNDSDANIKCTVNFCHWKLSISLTIGISKRAHRKSLTVGSLIVLSEYPGSSTREYVYLGIWVITVLYPRYYSSTRSSRRTHVKSSHSDFKCLKINEY